MTRRRLRLAALQRSTGYTLVELVVTMTIFLVVVGALASGFVSATNAEADMSSRFESQRNARLALDRLRRDVHCASGVTDTAGAPLPSSPVVAIKVAVPSFCPNGAEAGGTVVYQTVSVAANRWALRRTNGSGTTVTVADYLTNDDVFTYSAPASDRRGRLHVNLPVNRTPSRPWKQWRLVDDIVLRNTSRS